MIQKTIIHYQKRFISIEDIIDIVSYYVEIKKGKRHT